MLKVSEVGARVPACDPAVVYSEVTMTKVQRLEQEIKGLTPSELSAFREWFHEYDSVAWDKQIEQDAAANKLDKLAEKALADHKAGRTREI